jgi:predicted O-linked N-acetylglucosamine transferase (SPINDLY family)
MASNQSTLGTYLEKGLGGRTLKATFLLYLVSLLILCPVGYWMVISFGEERSLELLPIIVGFVVAFQYGVHFVVSRMASLKNAKESVSTQTSTALVPKQASQSLDKKSLGVASFEFHTNSEHLPLAVQLKSLRLAYAELIKLIESKEGLTSTGTYNVWVKAIKKTSIITLLISLISSAVEYLYRISSRESKIEELQKRIEVIESILRLEHKLMKYEIALNVRRKLETTTRPVSSHLNLSVFSADLTMESFSTLREEDRPNSALDIDEPLSQKASKPTVTSNKMNTKLQKKKKKRKNFRGRKH